MNKLLPILALFFFSCDEDTIAYEEVYGCTISTACNFNPDANIFDDTCSYGSDFFGCSNQLTFVQSNLICENCEGIVTCPTFESQFAMIGGEIVLTINDNGTSTSETPYYCAWDYNDLENQPQSQDDCNEYWDDDDYWFGGITEINGTILGNSFIVESNNSDYIYEYVLNEDKTKLNMSYCIPPGCISNCTISYEYTLLSNE